jgi:nucleoside-diphosphate-sugar epimerase
MTSNASPSAPVLVTGGSGFIGGHVVLRLLQDGHRVRTTVRSLDREAELRARLARFGVDAGDALELAAADLLDDAGWAEAIAGVEHVIHVASPLPHGAPTPEDELVVPAREGTRRVLQAARDAGVTRVVLTSAFHAIGFGTEPTEHVFTEDDWSPLDGVGMDAYGRSKVLAERTAWEVLEGSTTELVALHPVAVLGPVMGPDVSGGNAIERAILAGLMPGFPRVWIPIVDVRDVAAAHVAALTTPGAAGERILLSGAGLWLEEMGAILRDGLGDRAAKVPTGPLPAGADGGLGWEKRIDGSKAGRLLGFAPRDVRTTVLDTAESMLAAGIVAG